MYANELSPLPAGLVGAGLPVPGGLWGMLGSDILAASAGGEHGPGLAANDNLTTTLRYIYALETRSNVAVLLYPDSSHEGPVPYSGSVRLYEQGTGEVAATLAQRSFSVTTGAAVAPTIVTPPASLVVTAGLAASFSMAAAGTAPLAYQWRRDGVAISGATASTYAISAAQVSDSGAAFSVTVSNAAGSVTSSTASLTVLPAAVAPTIVTPPASLSVQAGEAAAFSVSASGTAPLSYQWRRGGTPIAGATASSYVLPSAQASDDGASFTVLVSNAAGSVVSVAAVLTVQAGGAVAPTVQQGPVGLTAQDGASVTFSAVINGTAPISFQWRRNGAAIAGATAASYIFTATLADNGAQYTLVASNAFGSVQTSAAVLMVQPNVSPPTIVTQPASVAWEAGATAQYSVVAAGALPLTYQWTRDGVPIAGATQPVVSIANVDLLDSRSQIQVVVSNAYGQVTSRRADLLVPVISVQVAKTGARIDDDRFDGDLPRWIDAAVRLAEQFCNRYFTPKTPGFERTDWPAASETFPVNEVRSVSVSYWDGAAWQTMGAGAVAYFADGSRTGIAPAAGTSWPQLGVVAGGPRVRVQFNAGPDTASSLPVEVEHFVIAYVSLWADENRAAAPQAVENFPWLYAGLEPLKVY
jgi:hypothetical protein